MRPPLTPQVLIEQLHMMLPFLMTISCVYLSLISPASCDQVNTQDVNHIANIKTDFALRFFTNIAKNVQGNVFCSPFSISSAFAMIQLGSDGETREELDQTFGFGNTLNDQEFHPIFKALSEKLSSSSDYYTFQIANRLFAAENYNFLESYLNDTLEYYNAPTERMDFSRTEECRTKINSWVEDQTANKIKDFIKQGVLTPDVVLVLINAIYFKAEWYKEFDKDLTKKTTFTNYMRQSIEVDMMYMEGYFMYGEDEDMDCKVVEIFYKDDKASMMLLLPKNDIETTKIEEKLVFNKWQDIKLESVELKLSIPKFKITQFTDLKPVLGHMGISDTFDPVAADFSRMTGHKGLYVSDAFHKAFIEVDEKGTEAAAATGIVMKESAAVNQPEFIADKPFVFIIKDVSSNTVLFTGRVGDPTQLETDIKTFTSVANGFIPIYCRLFALFAYFMTKYL